MRSGTTTAMRSGTTTAMRSGTTTMLGEPGLSLFIAELSQLIVELPTDLVAAVAEELFSASIHPLPLPPQCTDDNLARGIVSATPPTRRQCHSVFHPLQVGCRPNGGCRHQSALLVVFLASHGLHYGCPVSLLSPRIRTISCAALMPWAWYSCDARTPRPARRTDPSRTPGGSLSPGCTVSTSLISRTPSSTRSFSDPDHGESSFSACRSRGKDRERTTSNGRRRR